MAEKIVLTADKRELSGKQARSLRKQGIVPGVIYGSKLEATNVQFEPVSLQKTLKKAGRHAPIEISLAGKKHIALVKDVAYAPARNEIVHISFQAVSASEKVNTEVPVVLKGEDESEAKKSGLVILQTIEEIEVRAKTSDLPNEIAVDASKLAVAEEKLTLASVQIPKGVELVDADPDLVVATVWEPAALEAKNAAADEAASETPETAIENSDDSSDSSEESSEK